MRKISADYIFPVSSPPIKNGIVTLDDNGTILEIKKKEEENSDAEFYPGIIIPGFVNTHCHLELSYLKGKLPKGKGLDEFLREVEAIRRNFSEEEIQEALIKAEDEMFRNGIVAVGDISNSNFAFAQKSKGRIKYHTFIETLGFHPQRAEHIFTKAVHLQSQIISHASSIVPHAPYSASEKLLSLINQHAENSNGILSFHNQESADENKLFQNKTGKIVQRFENWEIDTDFFIPTKTNSLQFILPKLNHSKKILLVHNTCTAEEDIVWIKKYMENEKPSTINHQPSTIFFCFCPRSNLYIENKLPDIPLFVKEGFPITIGTDSLASNDSLSVLDELKTISEYFPSISFETLITWATKNGAEFLGMEKKTGTIEKGKKPGLLWLGNPQINFSPVPSTRDELSNFRMSAQKIQLLRRF